MTAVTMADLRRVGSDGTSSQGFLYCPKCGAECSANPGDYWSFPDDYAFLCVDGPMVLVRRESTLVEL